MAAKPEGTQVKQEEGPGAQVEPRYPGITEEAFNYLMNVATNHEMPQILKSADIQFEVLAPTIFGGSDHEKGL